MTKQNEEHDVSCEYCGDPDGCACADAFEAGQRQMNERCVEAAIEEETVDAPKRHSYFAQLGDAEATKQAIVNAIKEIKP